MIIIMCRRGNVKQGLAREIVISRSFVSLKYCGPMCAESWEPALSPDIGQSSQDHLQSGHVTNASVTISKTNTCHSINFQCIPGAPTLVGDMEDWMRSDWSWAPDGMWLAAVALHGNESIWLIQTPPCHKIQGPRSLTQGGPHWSTFNTSVFEGLNQEEAQKSMKQIRAISLEFA